MKTEAKDVVIVEEKETICLVQVLQVEAQKAWNLKRCWLLLLHTQPSLQMKITSTLKAFHPYKFPSLPVKITFK
jgi:hypothetical protein